MKMKKFMTAAVSVAALVGLGSNAFGAVCTIDAVPAATLLLPYFEVDLDRCGSADGFTTLFSINNASDEPVVAHVTLWTDFSVPSLDFDVYLTGYDVQTINLRDVFCNGILPVTADLDDDPADTISPQGPLSGDVVYPNCTAFPFPTPALDATLLGHIQGWHTGNASPVFGSCAGAPYGDNVARGYITIDVVNQCSLQFPGEPGYFADGGTGVASNLNVLWGDYFYVDDVNNFAQGDTLVHIEADENTFNNVGQYTFYGRYVGFATTDDREPLATTHAVRYIMGGTFDGGTELVVWRDSKDTSPSFSGYACGGAPPWFPLNAADVVAFDEAELPANLCVPTGSIVSPPLGEDPTCFPLETARYHLTSPTVPGADPVSPPFNFGWLYLNLNHYFPDATLDPTGGPAQSYVSAIMSAMGRFSVGFQAVTLQHACFENGLGVILVSP